MGARKHDLIATLINQEVTSFDELAANGVLPGNTEIKDIDYYLNIDKVKNSPMFQTNGEFDKDKFTIFHKSATQMYDDYANMDYMNKALEAIESSPRDWTKLDAQRYDTNAVVKITNLPNKSTLGMSTDPVARFSDAEMAQANYMRDENGNVLDWKPNDKAGLWNGVFRNPAALAIYEEDGVHEENGIMVYHKKGELQRDPNGNPFYQQLGSKSASGRELLKYTDLLTVEGQWLNEYDFLDSDDLRKSTAGIIAKTAFQIAPYFIPYVGTALKYVTAAKELVTAMPSFLKAFDNLFDSEDQTEDEFDQKMNRFANSMQTLKMGTSDAGKRGFWTFENLMNQVAMSVGQLYQQRGVAEIAKILPKEYAAKTGRALSTAYMALTTSQYAYDEFKNAGATDQVAGWGALASFASMYGLFSVDYFKQWLTKGTWLEERDAIKNTLREAVEEAQEELSRRATGDVLKGAKELTRFQASQLYQKVLYPIKSGLEKWATNLGVSKQAMGTVSQFANRSLNEGLEETAEEIVFDTIKGIFSAIESVSGKKLSDDVYESLNFNWNLEDAISRYTSSFFGGAIGGAIFEGLNQYEMYRSPGMLKFLDLDTRRRLMWLINNDHEKELLDELEFLYKRGLLGNENLSFIKKVVSEDIEKSAKNIGRVLYESGTEKDNQNELIYQELKATIQSLKHFLSSNQLLKSDPQILTDILRIRGEAIKAGAKTDEEIAKYFSENALNPKIDSLVKNGFFAFVTDEVGNAVARLNNLQVTIAAKEAEIAKAAVLDPNLSVGTNEDKIKEAIKNNEELKTLKEEFDELKAELADVMAGKQADYYIEKGLFLMDPVFKHYFLDKKAQFRQSVDQFYRFKYGKEFSEITDENEKKAAIKEYDTFIAKSEQDQLKETFKLFRAVNERFAGDLTKLDKGLEGVDFDPTFDRIINAQAEKRLNEITQRETELKKIMSDYSANPESQEYKDAELELQYLQREVNWINDKIIEPALTENGRNIIKSLAEYDLVYRADIEEQRKQSAERILILQNEYQIAETAGDINLANQKQIEIEAETEHLSSLVFSVKPLLDILRNYINDSKTKFRTSSKILDEIVTTILERLQENDKNIFSKIASEYRNIISKSLPQGKSFITKSMIDSFVNSLKDNPSNFKNLYESLISKVSKKIFASKNVDSSSTNVNAIITESYIEAKQHIDAILHINSEFGELIDLLIEDGTSEKPRNPVLDILQKLNIEIEGKPARILETVESEIAKYYSNPDEYQFPSINFGTDIENGLKLINIIRAVFDAASNGYNAEVNQYRDALSHTPFAILSDHSAQILKEQLDQLTAKLLTLKAISDSHRTMSDRFQTNCMLNMSGKLLKTIIHTDISEKVKAIEIDGKKLDIDLKAIWEAIVASSGIDINDITEENYEAFSLLEQKFRQEVANKFIEFTKNLTNDSKQSLGFKLAECFGTDVATEDSGVMTDDKEYEPTAMQSLLYLTTILGYDQQKYDGMWKTIVEGPEYKDFTPYYTQYMGIKIAWIRANNNHIFNGIVDYCKSINDESGDGYLKSRFSAYNLCCILGGPGTGKSSAMGRAIRIMTQLVGGEIIMAAKEDEQRANLKKNVDPSGNLPVLAARDLLSEIGYKESDVSIKKTNDGSWVEYIPPTDIKSPSFQSDGIKILMLDEISLFNGPELQALCASARQHGYTIIGLGDDKQNKAVFIRKNGNNVEMVSSSIEDGIIITTPSLTISMRAKNNAHYTNCINIDGTLINLVHTYKYNRASAEGEVAQELVKQSLISDAVTLFYLDEKEDESGDGFFGDKFIKSSNPVEEAKKWISRFKATGKTLIIIDENTERWNAFAEEGVVKVRKPLEVQSAEAAYAVVIKDQSAEDLFDAYRDLNTMMTRSEEGTVIISSEDKFGSTIKMTSQPLPTGGVRMNEGDDPNQVKIKERFKELATAFLKDVEPFTNSSSTPEPPAPQSQSQNPPKKDEPDNPFGGVQFSRTEIPKSEVNPSSVEEAYEQDSDRKLKDSKKWKKRKDFLETGTHKSDLKDFAQWLDSDHFVKWITTDKRSPFVNLKLTEEEISNLRDFIYGISIAIITKNRTEAAENYLRKIANKFNENTDDLYDKLNKIVDFVVGDSIFYNYVVSGKTIYCEINNNDRNGSFNVTLPIAITTHELEDGRYDDIVFEQRTQPIAMTTSGEEFSEVEKVEKHRMKVVGYGIYAPTQLSKLNKWTRKGNTIAAISHIPWLNSNELFMSFDGQREDDITRIGVQKRSTLYLIQKLIQAKAYLRNHGPAPFELGGEIKDVEAECINLLKTELSWDDELIDRLKETSITNNWTSHDWVDFYTSFAIISEESVRRMISALMAYVNTEHGMTFKDIFETNMSEWTQSAKNGVILEFKSSDGTIAPKRIFLEFVDNEIVNGKTNHKYKVYSVLNSTRGRQIQPIKKGNDPVIVSYSGKIIGFDTDSLTAILSDENILNAIDGSIVSGQLKNGTLNLNEALNNGLVEITFGKQSSPKDSTSDYVYGLSEEDLVKLLKNITLTDNFDDFVSTGQFKNGLYLDIKGSNYYSYEGMDSDEFKIPNSVKRMECDIKQFLPPVYAISITGSKLESDDVNEFSDISKQKTGASKPQSLEYTSYSQEDNVITFNNGVVNDSWIHEYLKDPISIPGKITITNIDLGNRTAIINGVQYQLNDKWTIDGLDSSKKESDTYIETKHGRQYSIGKGEIFSGSDNMIIVDVRGNTVKFYDRVIDTVVETNIRPEYSKHFKKYQNSGLEKHSFWFISPGKDGSDPFIVYRGKNLSDNVVIKTLDGQLNVGVYNDDRTIITKNGLLYEVPDGSSDYYSNYGLKLQRKTSEIKIHEDDSSVTDGSIFLEKRGCAALASNEGDAISGYITHIDVNNRTFTINKKTFSWKKNVTLSDFGLSENNRVFGNKSKKNEFINTLREQWGNLPIANHSFTLKDIIEKINNYSGDNVKVLLQSIVEEMNSVFKNVYRFGTKYIVSVSDSGSFKLEQIMKQQYLAGFAVWSEYKSDDIKFDEEIDESCIEAKFIVSLPNGSQESGFVKKINGKWVVKSGIEKTRSTDEILNELSIYIDMDLLNLIKTAITISWDEVNTIAINNGFYKNSKIGRLIAELKNYC